MATFNAIDQMASELVDREANGFTTDRREDFYETARKIQRAFNRKKIDALEAIASDFEQYTAAEQRVADLALYILYQEKGE